jgi:endonuclease/exonuclease/phosphatase family metal-dependent hydrolase
MTYNIHSCVNTDGRVGLERIAGVIAELAPDLVALQEVDAGIPRTNNQDQAEAIGEMTGMAHRFFPLVVNGNQKYGLAILSRLPFQNLTVGRLPMLYPKLKLNLQKRGVMWAMFETSSGPLHFFNTHLSLYKLERRKQLRVLLGSDWLAAVPENDPVILCGDLNAMPLSPVYRRLSRRLTDVQKNSTHVGPPRSTFPSRRPFFRIDHIFVSGHLEIEHVIVPNNENSRLASDHLPVCVDLRMELGN